MANPQADIQKVQANVKYLANSKWAGRYNDFEVSILNGRQVTESFDLDQQGFELVDQNTAVTNFFDDTQISSIYEAEMVDLLTNLTGATKVYVFDHTRRADSRSMREEKVVREPAGVIHNDYTAASAANRVRDLFSPDEVQQVLQNNNHRWFYFPQMQANEALLIKTFDSATDGRAQFSVHTAFEDPTAAADAIPRESIETRALLFY